MAIITTLKDAQGRKVYPKTKASAVYDETGVALSTLLTNINSNIDGLEERIGNIEAAETAWSAITNKPFESVSTDTLAVTEGVLGVKADVYAAKSHVHDAADITTGTIDIARLPKAALERLVKVADDAARFALTAEDVQVGDTVQTLDNEKMYLVVDTEKLGEEAGYQVYVAGSAASVDWSGVQNKPTEFTPATHTHEIAGVTGLQDALDSKIGSAGVAAANVEIDVVEKDTAFAAENTDTVKGWFSKLVAKVKALATVAFSGSYNDLTDKPDATKINRANGTTTVEASLVSIEAAMLTIDAEDVTETADIVVASETP